MQYLQKSVTVNDAVYRGIFGAGEKKAAPDIQKNESIQNYIRQFVTILSINKTTDYSGYRRYLP